MVYRNYRYCWCTSLQPSSSVFGCTNNKCPKPYVQFALLICPKNGQISTWSVVAVGINTWLQTWVTSNSQSCCDQFLSVSCKLSRRSSSRLILASFYKLVYCFFFVHTQKTSTGSIHTLIFGTPSSRHHPMVGGVATPAKEQAADKWRLDDDDRMTPFEEDCRCQLKHVKVKCSISYLCLKKEKNSKLTTCKLSYQE